MCGSAVRGAWSMARTTQLSSHLIVGEWDGSAPTEPAHDPIGSMMREEIDDADISQAFAEVDAALRTLDGEQLDAYRTAFNEALEGIRNQ